MDKYVCIIIYNYLNINDLIKMMNIKYVVHPLVWKGRNILVAHSAYFEKIKGLPITQLCIKHIYLSPANIKHICKIKTLRTLSLCFTDITDGKYISHLNLDTLDVSFTNITDSFVKDICNMKLHTLDLSCTNVSDKCIKYLCKMNLQTLCVLGTQINVDKLKHVMPNTQLRHVFT